MNNRGQFPIFGVIVVGILMFMFVIGIFVIPIVATLIQSSGLTIGDTIDTLPSVDDSLNVTQNLQTMSDPVFTSFRFMEWITYILIIGFIAMIIGVAAFSRTYPIIAIPYVIIILALAVSGMFISSAYNDIAGANAYVRTWTMTDFMLMHLPAVIIVIGLIGGVAMFILITTRPEAIA